MSFRRFSWVPPMAIGAWICISSSSDLMWTLVGVFLVVVGGYERAM